MTIPSFFKVKKIIALFAVFLIFLTASSGHADDECAKLKLPIKFTYKKAADAMPVFINQDINFTVDKGGADSWKWDFGDAPATNEATKEETTIHKFERAGTYRVALTPIKEVGGKECVGEPYAVDIIVNDERLTSCSCFGELTQNKIADFNENDLAACVDAVRESYASLGDSQCKERKKCAKYLGFLEERLRKKGDILLQSLDELDKAKKTPNVVTSEQNEKDLKNKLKTIETTIPFTGTGLFQSFDDYDQIFFKFNLGYEFNSVDHLFQKGFPRVGFMFYSRNFEDRMPADYPASFWAGWSQPNFHFAFNAHLTSSSEAATDFSSSTPPAVKNPGDRSALEFNIPLFFALYHSRRFDLVSNTEALRDDKLWFYFGPIVEFGGVKVDKDNNGNPISRFDLRFYEGFRFAINPEWYADFLYGRTESIDTKRLEIRGQLPIYRFDNGTRLFLGAKGNFALDRSKAKAENEADIWNVYLTWNVDFKDFYKYFSGSK